MYKYTVLKWLPLVQVIHGLFLQLVQEDQQDRGHPRDKTIKTQLWIVEHFFLIPSNSIWQFFWLPAIHYLANYVKRQFDDLFIFIYLWAGYGPSWLPWHAQLARYSTFTLQSVELARDLKSDWCSSLFWQHLCCQNMQGTCFMAWFKG